MSKSTTMPLAERVHNVEIEVDEVKVGHAKLEQYVEDGFGRFDEKLDTIVTNVGTVSDQVSSLVKMEQDRELASLRKKWGLATKILGAISLTLLGGFIKWGLDKILGH